MSCYSFQQRCNRQRCLGRLDLGYSSGVVLVVGQCVELGHRGVSTMSQLLHFFGAANSTC